MTAPEQTPAACLLCGGEMTPWLEVPGDWRRPDVNAAYSLYWCGTCAFGQLHPRPTEKEVAGFYNVVSYYTHSEANTEAAPPPSGLAERLRRRLAWAFDYGRPLDSAEVRAHLPADAKRVADLGCGNGALLAELQDTGLEGIGLEPDPAARAQAQARGLTVYEGTLESPPEALQETPFDGIVLSHVLEHCLNPVAALGNAAMLLAPGGTVLCETPNNAALGMLRQGVCWYWLDVPRHLNFFTAESLERICSAAGLAVAGREYAGYFRQFTADWIGAEQGIRDAFAEAYTGVRRNSAAQAWGLLAGTALAPTRRKYDSVRVVARAAG